MADPPGPQQKTQIFRLRRLDGGVAETSLRYGESRALCERCRADQNPTAISATAAPK